MSDTNAYRFTLDFPKTLEEIRGASPYYGELKKLVGKSYYGSTLDDSQIEELLKKEVVFDLSENKEAVTVSVIGAGPLNQTCFYHEFEIIGQCSHEQLAALIASGKVVLSLIGLIGYAPIHAFHSPDVVSLKEVILVPSDYAGTGATTVRQLNDSAMNVEDFYKRFALTLPEVQLYL